MELQVTEASAVAAVADKTQSHLGVAAELVE
jgi:hypothetical protein